MISWRVTRATDNCTRKVLGELRSLPALSEDVDPNPSPALRSPSLVTAASSQRRSHCLRLASPGPTCGLSAWERRASVEIATSPGATWQNLPISREEFAPPGGLGRNRQHPLMFVGCKGASR